MSLQSINLNLLPLLRELLKHCSVTLAARSLGVSQSAASQGLAKLRAQMNDPLLVQIRGRLQLTPLAITLIPRIETLIAELDDLFLQSKFDPRRAERTFVIAASDYMVYLMARRMLDLQRTEAPGITIHFIEIGPDFIERMASQEIDFAFLPRFAALDLTVAPLRYRKLFTDPGGVLMDRAHPLAVRDVISEADLAPYAFVVFNVEAFERIPSKHWKQPAEVAPFWKMMRKVAIRTNHYTLVPSLLQDTDLVSFIPYRVGLELSRVWPTVVRRLSFATDKIESGFAWSPVFDADPAHAWLRTQIEARLTNSPKD